jgi:hypothetical protein
VTELKSFRSVSSGISVSAPNDDRHVSFIPFQPSPFTLDQCTLQAVLQIERVESFIKGEEYKGGQIHILERRGNVKNDAETNRNEYFTLTIFTDRYVDVPEIRAKSRIIPENKCSAFRENKVFV